MSLILARIIVSVVLFVAPFLLFALASRNQHAGMVLILPMAGAIPAVVAALILFVPIEHLLDARGWSHLKNLAIPAAGGAIIFIFMLVMGAVWGNLGMYLQRLATGGWQVWGVYLVWAGLGALWGLVWRSTEWLAKWTGLANG